MLDRNHGWYAVAETGQGGGLPDTLHGPYGTQQEAIETADDMRAGARAIGRLDNYTPVLMEILDADNG